MRVQPEVNSSEFKQMNSYHNIQVYQTIVCPMVDVASVVGGLVWANILSRSKKSWFQPGSPKTLILKCALFYFRTC